MKVEVEVISTNIIKPSTPTPDHLRRYQLSVIDRVSPTIYNSSVYFFPADGDTKSHYVEKFERLEQSLSETLTRFYPLAGRLIDNLYVECNDKGIPSKHGRVNCKLSHVLENPTSTTLEKLLPLPTRDIGEFLAGIQLNVFECGGIGLGLCISHTITDALSFLIFFNSWAATTRGDPFREVNPEFVSAKQVPPGPEDLFGYEPSTPISKEPIVAKRFVLSNSSIQKLISKYNDRTKPELQPRPSRVQILSGVMWSLVVRSIKEESGNDRLHLIRQLVNLRPRMNPPLSEYSFGNIYWYSVAVLSREDEKNPLNFVRKARESINQVRNECLNLLKDNGKVLGQTLHPPEIPDGCEPVIFGVTSLCNFPLYEVDFGWGKPVWVATIPRPFQNFVSFSDTASRDGIEVIIHLTKADMAKLEANQEFIAFIASSRSY